MNHNAAWAEEFRLYANLSQENTVPAMESTLTALFVTPPVVIKAT